jgi:arylsulfatase A-like enzyme/O-glycosyl hydrolase
VTGEASSGLFLFNQSDFLNGLDAASVIMDAANDTVSFEAGFINPNNAASGTTIRFVLRDDSGYHISDAQPLLSNAAFSFEATTMSYSAFTPAANTATEAGTIGGASTPSFTGITWVGFRIDAVRGTDTSLGVNIGVELFSVEGAAGPAFMMVDGGLRHQKIEGFGASAAFNINKLINNVHSNELADLLFQDLSLDILRIRNMYFADENLPFMDYVDDTVDTIALGEAALGRPLKILMSAWTPPTYLKSNNNKAGGTLASDVNGYRYDDYAQWWADSLNYYEGEGVVPEYISIQNEPNFTAVYSTCKFDPVETTNNAGYNYAFEAVWQQLAIDMGTDAMPKMLGPELVAFNKLDDYINNLIQPPHMYGYAHHLYSSNVGTNPSVLNAQMQSTNDDFGYKPLLQTEYFNGDSPTEWLRKYNLAKLMHNSLTLEEVSAYLYWCLYWPIDGGQALITLPDNTSYDINPEYYAFKHYSAFIDADWRRLEATSSQPGIDLSAYINPGEDKVTVVVLNENPGAADLDINFMNVVITAGDIYRSTATLNCTNVGTFNPAASLSVPGESITTLVLTAATNPAPTDVNILMIAIDDLRPETRSYGAAQMITPNLDQLASDGYQFNRAYAQQAVCGPSRASFMTGLRPDTTQIYQFDGNFRATIPWAYTLPQVLSQQGYHSVGIGKIYHGGTNDELSWDEPWSQGSGTYGSTGGYAYENAAVADNALRDGAVTDEAILKLADLTTNQPFFYGVGYVRPHLPFVAPTAYWDLYNTNDLVLPYTDDPAVDASTYAYTTWGELRGYTDMPATGPVSAEQERNLIHGYYACVSYVDAQIGRLMDALEAEGLAENTIVVVWGDHGFHLGDHGQWCKHTNFERATRIPLIIKVPWMPGASQVDALVEALDVYPTLLDLCGIDQPYPLQGDSLVPLLQNPDAVGPPEAVSQFPRSGESIMGYGMRTDRYRYVEWRALGSDTPVDTELYDHFLNPGEDTNVVSSTDGAVVAALSAQLAPYIGTAYRAANDGFGNQLITDGEFNSGMTHWEKKEQNGATAAFTPLSSDGSNGLGDDPLLLLNPINPGASIWQLSLTQVTGINANKSYTIRFSARAEAARNMKIIWKNKTNSPNADYYNSGTFSISTTAQIYEFNNIVPANVIGTTDPDAELRLQFGADAKDVWIDSVEVYEEVPIVPIESFASALTNAGLTGADALAFADADEDGVNNVVEYAFNLDMTASDRHRLVAGTGTSGLPTYLLADAGGFDRLDLEYLRRLNTVELEYLPEFTGNLVSGVWESPIAVETVVPVDSNWERVTVQDLETTGTASNRFGRVPIRFVP